MKNSSCTPRVVGIFCATVLALGVTLRAEASNGDLGVIQPTLDGANVSAVSDDSGVILLAENILGDGGRFDLNTSDPGVLFENKKKSSKKKKAPKKKSPKEPKMPKQPKQPKQPKAPKATKQAKQKKQKAAKTKKTKK